MQNPARPIPDSRRVKKIVRMDSVRFLYLPFTSIVLIMSTRTLDPPLCKTRANFGQSLSTFESCLKFRTGTCNHYKQFGSSVFSIKNGERSILYRHAISMCANKTESWHFNPGSNLFSIQQSYTGLVRPLSTVVFNTQRPVCKKLWTQSLHMQKD